MKSTLVFGITLALLAPVVAWQTKPSEQTPLVPVTTVLREAQSIESLPFRINAPGRYVLAGSLTSRLKPPRGSEAGIVIQADHVELDLGGHVLTGAEGSTSGIVAVLPEKRDELVDICVRNGTVTRWGGEGVDLGVVQGARLVDLRAWGNGAPRTTALGLRAGPSAIVEDCASMSNTGAGIVAGEGSRIDDCVADRNGLEGFLLGPHSAARGCIATRNGRDGLLLGAGGGVAVECLASGNGGDGIDAVRTARLRDCSASANLGSGLAVGRGSLVLECLSADNQLAGIFAAEGLCRIEGNHLSLNGSDLDVTGSGHIVVRNTLSSVDLLGATRGGAGMLADVSPGGVYVPEPGALRLVLKGAGSLIAKPGQPELALDETDDELAAWANIAVK
jgi:hypothetical protein